METTNIMSSMQLQSIRQTCLPSRRGWVSN